MFASRFEVVVAASLAGGLGPSPAAAAEPDAPRVILVGDSTMAPRTGYGDALCRLLGPTVECVNLAKGGRSSKSYRADGSWKRVAALLADREANRKTCVLIQFGHNDQPGKVGRSTNLESEFPANIAAYVAEVRRAGAMALLVTPLTRRSFRGEVLNEDLEPWASATRRVASIAGVPVLELNAESSAAVARMGATEADTLAMESAKDFDHTHLGAKGAEFFARMVAKELAAAMLAFAPMALAQDTRKVVEPQAPPFCAVVAAKAVAAPAREEDTTRIQDAIDACPARRAVRLAAEGGGATFVSGPLTLKPGVTLWLDRGVTLYASTDPRAYDWGKHLCGTNDAHGHGCRPFISVRGGEGGGIMGDGVIDGRGGEVMEGNAETWWQLARRAQRERLHQNVPRLVVIDGAREFTLHRVTLRNSPNFHVTLHGVDGFTAWGVKIDAPADARNTDGIDPVSSRNVSIVASFIRTGDDNVAIKAGRDGPSENISIVDNHFYNGHGMSIGSETVGGVRNVRVERLTMEGSTSGLRIKSDVSRGGRVHEVRYSDICMRNVGKPIDIDTRYDRDARGNSVPVYTGLSFERIAVADSTLEATTQCEGRFVAFPDEAKIAARIRPQLSDAQARGYSYAEVLGPWDPLSDPLATGAALPADYVVDASGARGAFATIQAAVSEAATRAAATRRKDRIHILVKPGRYNELVYVPESTAPITLYGDGSDASAVRIVADLDAATPGSRYGEKYGAQFSSADPSIVAMFASVKERAAVGTPGSAVAWIRNAGFQARTLTFENAYNKARGDAVENGSAHSQAVALMVDDADRVQFENVRFEGFQDTLYLKSSSPARIARSFFHASYVEGDMDFIFGEATAYFLATEIRSLGDRAVSYLLAPGTHYQSRFGFVFMDCAFTHDGKPNALAGTFKLARQWFRGQRCTPYASVDATPGYACTLGPADAYDSRTGTISRAPIEAVGKVAILESRIGPHVDKTRPWSDWNNRGTIKYRPAQYDSDDYWDHLVHAGIDPVRELGYAARKTPAEPFLAEYRNTDN